VPLLSTQQSAHQEIRSEIAKPFGCGRLFAGGFSCRLCLINISNRFLLIMSGIPCSSGRIVEPPRQHSVLCAGHGPHLLQRRRAAPRISACQQPSRKPWPGGATAAMLSVQRAVRPDDVGYRRRRRVIAKRTPYSFVPACRCRGFASPATQHAAKTGQRSARPPSTPAPSFWTSLLYWALLLN